MSNTDSWSYAKKCSLEKNNNNQTVVFLDEYVANAVRGFTEKYPSQMTRISMARIQGLIRLCIFRFQPLLTSRFVPVFSGDNVGIPQVSFHFMTTGVSFHRYQISQQTRYVMWHSADLSVRHDRVSVGIHFLWSGTVWSKSSLSKLPLVFLRSLFPSENRSRQLRVFTSDFDDSL